MAITADQIAEICARVVQQMTTNITASAHKIKKFDHFDSKKETWSVYLERFGNYCSRNKLTDDSDSNGKERAQLLLDSLSDFVTSK